MNKYGAKSAWKDKNEVNGLNKGSKCVYLNKSKDIYSKGSKVVSCKSSSKLPDTFGDLKEEFYDLKENNSSINLK